MAFATLQDSLNITNEMPYEARDLPTTIYEMLRITTDKFGQRPAVSYQLLSGPNDKAETLNWQEFHDKVVQAANLFRSLKLGKEDVIALVMPNTTETAIAIIGAMVAGIANPINPLLEPEQIGAILRETGAKVVVTLHAFPKTDIAQKTAEAVRHAPNVHTILTVDLNRHLAPPKSWIVPLMRPKVNNNHHASVLRFNAEAAKQPKTLTFEDVKEDRVAAYFHTGGTTGMPKVAQHKNSGIIYQGWIGDELLYTEEECVMCPLPLFHVLACHVILIAVIKSGAHVVLPTPAGYRGDGVFDNFWKLCERWKTTFIITVPTAVSALMQKPVNADLSTIKNVFSGSAPMPRELFHRFAKVTGIDIIEGYGLTEATVLVSCNPVDGEKKIGSVGIPFPYTDVRILHEAEDGSPVECATDAVGEICVSNPGVNPGDTYTEAVKNKHLYFDIGNRKYLRTGDLGRIDSDGYVWITGRSKDLIIRGGHNIDPADIEDALLAHKDVAFAGAIGQPDAHAGEVPCAYVELVEGGTATADELMEHAKVHIHERAAYPKFVGMLDELPKTAVGKVFKPDLRKLAITRVYNAALEKAGSGARVTSVVEDKKRGLVAQVTTGGASEDEINHILGAFTRPWEPAEPAEG